MGSEADIACRGGNPEPGWGGHVHRVHLSRLKDIILYRFNVIVLCHFDYKSVDWVRSSFLFFFNVWVGSFGRLIRFGSRHMMTKWIRPFPYGGLLFIHHLQYHSCSNFVRTELWQNVKLEIGNTDFSSSMSCPRVFCSPSSFFSVEIEGEEARHRQDHQTPKTCRPGDWDSPRYRYYPQMYPGSRSSGTRLILSFSTQWFCLWLLLPQDHKTIIIIIRRRISCADCWMLMTMMMTVLILYLHVTWKSNQLLLIIDFAAPPK